MRARHKKPDQRERSSQAADAASGNDHRQGLSLLSHSLAP